MQYNKKFEPKNIRYKQLVENNQFRTCSKCLKQLPAYLFWNKTQQILLETCTVCKIEQAKSEGKKLKIKRVPKYKRNLPKAGNVTVTCGETVISTNFTYDSYIQSVQWKNKRKEYFQVYPKPDCYCCGRKFHIGMELHHRTYVNFGNENLEDLVPVCKSCHDEITEAWNIEKTLNTYTLWEVTDIVRSKYDYKRIDKYYSLS